jgi:hypothetical protein
MFYPLSPLGKGLGIGVCTLNNFNFKKCINNSVLLLNNIILFSTKI